MARLSRVVRPSIPHLITRREQTVWNGDYELDLVAKDAKPAFANDTIGPSA